MSLRKLLYTPSGRAGAYANGGYAANLFKGCGHGCLYCYVPGFCRVDRGEFHDSVTPAPDVLLRLSRDLARVGVVPDPIFLCFTCDPYPEDHSLSEITREAIRLINASGNAVNLLTKGGMRAARDFDLLAANPNNRIGATLTFIDDEHSLEWEPYATLPPERIAMLATAKRDGIKTWASIEPVIMPSQSMAIMEVAHDCVDEFKIGKWNHDDRADKINWKKFLAEAEGLMKQHGKKYVIKEDLAKAAIELSLSTTPSLSGGRTG